MMKRRGYTWAFIQLTEQERMFVAVIAIIALIGLAARYWHIHHQEPETLQLSPAEQTAYDHAY